MLDHVGRIEDSSSSWVTSSSFPQGFLPDVGVVPDVDPERNDISRLEDGVQGGLWNPTC